MRSVSCIGKRAYSSSFNVSGTAYTNIKFYYDLLGNICADLCLRLLLKNSVFLRFISLLLEICTALEFIYFTTFSEGIRFIHPRSRWWLVDEDNSNMDNPFAVVVLTIEDFLSIGCSRYESRDQMPRVVHRVDEKSERKPTRSLVRASLTNTHM